MPGGYFRPLRGRPGSRGRRRLTSRARAAVDPYADAMKYVVIGEPSGASMDEIMAVYPRHKVGVDAFVERGDVIGIGPFGDRGNMAIFRSEEAAEAFVAQDP